MERKWWHGKTAYQIYPKSFCDSNGDGVGDLRGIIGKLDYLQRLGVEIVWISPVYASPFADQGYDISDYYAIDPVFGTMADMEELLAQAKKRGIGIVMDLVVNHCSDEHRWFREACRDPYGKYGRYFCIEPVGKDGALPCNWRSYFGGSVWEPLPGHPELVYLHMFHRKQPDLNWENPELRQEIYDMVNWWLDKGLAGFRLDAIVNICKPPYRNYPPDRADGLCSPYRMLEEAEGLEDRLEALAEATFRRHDAFTVGELFTAKPVDLRRYVGDKGVFSTMFDFAETRLNGSDLGWYDQAPVTPEQYKRTCFASQRQMGDIGFYANIIENHDEPRGVCRYLPECTPAGKKLLGGVSFLLRGLPFLYQGQEIGMENCPCETPEDMDDVMARDEYQVALRAGLTEKEALDTANRFSRDNARTPMQWSGEPNAGFTTGTPWLRVNPNYPGINVASQLEDPDSLWNFYRKLIELRKKYPQALVYGELQPYLAERENLMAYFRGDSLLVLGNFQAQSQTVPLPGRPREILLNNLGAAAVEDNSLTLAGWQLVVLSL